MSTPTLPSDPDNDGLTQYYGIRYPKPGESVRLAQQQMEALAVTVDDAMHSIAVEYGPAASEAYVDQQVAQAAPPGNFDIRMVGNRVGQFVEKRADGSVSVGTVTYVNDLPTKIEFTNPVRTFTFTATNGQITNVGVS